MVKRHAPPRAVVLSGDSPYTFAPEADTTLPTDGFFEAYATLLVHEKLREQQLMVVWLALPRAITLVPFLLMSAFLIEVIMSAIASLPMMNLNSQCFLILI